MQSAGVVLDKETMERRLATYRAVYTQKPYQCISHLTPELRALYYDSHLLADVVSGQVIKQVRGVISNTCAPLLISSLGLTGWVLHAGPLATMIDMACTQGIGTLVTMAPRISHDRAEKREKGHKAMQRAFYAIIDDDDETALQAFRGAKQYMDGLDRSLFSKAFQVEFARGFKEFCDRYAESQDFDRASFAKKVSTFVQANEGEPGIRGKGLQKYTLFANDPKGVMLNIGVVMTNPLRLIRNSFKGPEKEEPLTGWFVEQAHKHVSPIQKGLDRDDLEWMHEVMEAEEKGVHPMRAVLSADHGRTYYARKAQRFDYVLEDTGYMNHNFLYRTGRHFYHTVYDIFSGPKNLWLDAVGRMTQAGRDARRDEAHSKIRQFVESFACDNNCNPYIDVYGHLSDKGIRLLQEVKQVYNRVTSLDGQPKRSEDFRSVMQEALISVPLSEHQKRTLLTSISLTGAELQRCQLSKNRKGLSDNDISFLKQQSYSQHVTQCDYQQITPEQAHVGQALSDLEASHDLAKTLVRKQQQVEGSEQGEIYKAALTLVEKQLSDDKFRVRFDAMLAKASKFDPTISQQQMKMALLPPIMRQLSSECIERYVSDKQSSLKQGKSLLSLPTRACLPLSRINEIQLNIRGH